MLQNYIKIAFRNLWKNKIYSGVNIIGLALGLVCCTAIGLYILDEFGYDRFHSKLDRIFRVVSHQKQADGLYNVAVTPGPLAPTLTKDFPEVEKATRIGRWHGSLSRGTKTVEAESMLITEPSFFSTFDFPLVAGNAQKVLTTPNDVVISEAMALRLFGENWSKQGILGQSLMFSNETPLVIAGVARTPPTHSTIQFDVLLPYKWLEKTDEWSQKWNSNNYHTYVLLKPEAAEPANMASFSAKLSGQLNRYTPTEDKLYLQAFSDSYLKSKFDFETDWGLRSDMLYIRIFLAVGLILLLIAVVNFINLATARASHRAREVGVRKTIGAPRSWLVIQFLGEALLMTCLAVAMSLLLVQLLLPVFNELAAKTLELPVHEPYFWLALAGLTLIVGLLTGLYPAFFLSSFRPAHILKGTGAAIALSVQSGRVFRQSLVVGQFALAVGLIIGSVVIYRQLAFVQHKKLGFDQSQLMYVRLKGELRNKVMPFKQAVQQLPGVTVAAPTTGALIDMTNQGDIEWEGQQPNDKFLITNMNVDPDFMTTTGMKLAAGRNFSWRIPSDTSATLGAFMLNETAAKRMGWTPEQAIGKRLKFWGPSGVVVGVLNDFHFRPLRVAIEPFIFRFRPDNPYFNLLVRTKPGAVPQTIAGITALCKKIEPGSPISYGFVDQELDAQYRAEQRMGRVILYFSILSIFVSCLGLFGLATFTAEARTKEIGVRKVLGASVGSVVALLSKDFIKPVLMGILIASPVAWYAMTNWLRDFAYKVDLDWWVFALSGTLAIAVALLTVSIQSLKAALVNPVKSLRAE